MKLEGKIIDFLGDSITEGVGVKDRANNRFDNLMKKKYNLKAVYNYGVGGSRLAHQSVPSEKPRHDLCFCGRVYDINPEADIIVVYGGVNDYFHGDAPVGKPDDKTPATFYGAVEFLMHYIKTNFPGKTVVFLTPAHFGRADVFEERPSPRPMKKPDALPLAGYADIIIEKAAKYSYPILNMSEKLGIDPRIESDRVKYTSDGLHFNDAGHAVIADCIGAFLESL